jgi:hypothetical protein
MMPDARALAYAIASFRLMPRLAPVMNTTRRLRLALLGEMKSYVS